MRSSSFAKQLFCLFVRRCRKALQGQVTRIFQQAGGSHRSLILPWLLPMVEESSLHQPSREQVDLDEQAGGSGGHALLQAHFPEQEGQAQGAGGFCLSLLSCHIGRSAASTAAITTARRRGSWSPMFLGQIFILALTQGLSQGCERPWQRRSSSRLGNQAFSFASMPQLAGVTLLQLVARHNPDHIEVEARDSPSNCSFVSAARTRPGPYHLASLL